MTLGVKGLHHFHKRKRVYELGEPYPHPEKHKRFVDKIIYVIGVIGPVMTLPQILKIFILKDAAGVSAVSWLAYAIVSLFWIYYGILHKEKPIIITYVLWFVMNSLVAIGAFMY